METQQFLPIKDADVNIVVGNSPDIKSFLANKNVLDNHSSYFTSLLSTQFSTQDGENNNITILLPDISPKIFEIILYYFYTGSLTLNKFKALDIIQMLVAAEKLGCQDVVEFLQHTLIEKKSSWMEKNFIFIYQMSIENSRFKLQQFCQEFIEKSPELIFQLSNFSSIPEVLLMSLIKRDDLLLDESIIWENVLKWGLARNPNISSPDPRNWSNEEVNAMNETLKEIFPYIRISQLTSQQFYEKAHLYIFRLQPQLHEKLLKFYLVPGSEELFPPRLNEVNGSKIIDNHHIFSHIFAYLSKLINNEMIYRDLDYNQRINYNPYELKLLLRGSRHGFTPKIFHELCDNKPGTVTIIKVKGEDEILGGYNPGVWAAKNGYEYSKSFIFSLKDKLENISISHVEYGERALNYGTHYGPSFGLSDLIISGKNFKYGGRCFCKMDDYKHHIRNNENMFSVEDYEVFQVIKKD